MELKEKQIIKKTEEVIELLKKEKIKEAVKKSKKLSPYRLTGILGDFPLETINIFLQLMVPGRAADVLNQFPEEFAGTIIMNMNTEDLVAIFEEMTGDELVDYFPHISEEKNRELLRFLPENIREEVDFLSEYPEETVGAHMEQDYIAVKKGSSVENVTRDIKEKEDEIEHTDYIFIINEKGVLEGLVSLKDLMFTTKQKNIEDIMRTELITAFPGDSAMETAHRLRTRRFKMIPVVDKNDVLIGIITLEKAVNLLSENLADDIVAFSGSTGEESFFTRSSQSIKLRLPWMAANIFLNLGAVTIISSFEETIAQIAILAAFLPMITDMGGNVGIQALSVSIRSLALGEAQLRDTLRALKKELKIGLFNGLSLGVIFAFLSFFLQRNLVLSLVAGAALGVNVLVAGAIGGTMPFLIKKIGKDPAMMTGPILTTITDITGVTIYLGLTTILLVYII